MRRYCVRFFVLFLFACFFVVVCFASSLDWLTDDDMRCFESNGIMIDASNQTDIIAAVAGSLWNGHIIKWAIASHMWCCGTLNTDPVSIHSAVVPKYRNDKLHYEFIKTVNEMCAYGLCQFYRYMPAFPRCVQRRWEKKKKIKSMPLYRFEPISIHKY